MSKDDVLLTDGEVRDFYRPSFVKILLPSWSGRNARMWDGLREELQGSSAVLEGVEVPEAEYYTVESNGPLIRDTFVLTEVRISYTIGGVSRAILLKTGVYTARGWRVMQIDTAE